MSTRARGRTAPHCNAHRGITGHETKNHFTAALCRCCHRVIRLCDQANDTSTVRASCDVGAFTAASTATTSTIPCLVGISARRARHRAGLQDASGIPEGCNEAWPPRYDDCPVGHQLGRPDRCGVRRQIKRLPGLGPSRRGRRLALDVPARLASWCCCRWRRRSSGWLCTLGCQTEARIVDQTDPEIAARRNRPTARRAIV